MDIVHRVARQPVPGSKVASESVEFAAGGPAAGAAVAVAALGGEVTLVTALGSHPLARLALDDLARCGVQVLDVGAGSAVPPVSSVVVSTVDGERTVVGASAPGSTAAAPAAALDLALTADVVLVDGHYPVLAVDVARAARGPVVLDAGSAKDVHALLWPYLTVCAASAAYTGPLSGVPVAIRTAGPDPVWWSAGGASGWVPAESVTAVDTLGAGDVWHGAFAYFLAQHGISDVARLVALANRVAAVRVSHAGARSWIGAL